LRQLRDAKIKPSVELTKSAELQLYARARAWALAIAHARSGDPVKVSNYLGRAPSSTMPSQTPGRIRKLTLMTARYWPSWISIHDGHYG
jgi:hypothetical protein